MGGDTFTLWRRRKLAFNRYKCEKRNKRRRGRSMAGFLVWFMIIVLLLDERGLRRTRRRDLVLVSLIGFFFPLGTSVVPETSCVCSSVLSPEHFYSPFGRWRWRKRTTTILMRQGNRCPGKFPHKTIHLADILQWVSFMLGTPTRKKYFSVYIVEIDVRKNYV